MADDDGLQEVLSSLASCSLDSAEESERLETLEKAFELVKIDHGSLLSQTKAPQCSSVDATKRVVDVYCNVLKEANDEDVKTRLCVRLCNTLKRCGDGVDLVKSCSVTASADDALWGLSQKGNLVAVTLGIATEGGGGHTRQEWLDCFLEQTLLGTKICAPQDVQLSSTLLESITQEEWDSKFAPAIGKKIKASPEKVLEVVDVLVKSLTKGLKVDASELLAPLTKQLKSAKPNMRTSAASILVSMALIDADGTMVNIAAGIASCLSTLLQPEFRQGAYKAIAAIGEQVPKDLAETNKLGEVLSGLTTALAKETKASVTAREAGLKALVLFLAVAKRQSSADTSDAITFLRKPLETNNGADTVQRMGAMFLTVNQDVQETLVLDILASSPKAEKGLLTLVENATKKSTLVSATEGLVATNMVLVNALGSGKPDSLTPAFQKVLSAGSLTIAKTSFLYSKSLTDAVVETNSNNPLVRQLLPRTIALYVKLLAKQEKNESIFGAKSSAAHAMACCIANTDDNTTILLSSVQTITTYDAKAHTSMTKALFDHVNTTTTATESSSASLSDESSDAIRQVAQKLATKSNGAVGLTKALILMHTMTTTTTCSSEDEEQRAGLVENTLQIIKNVVLSWSDQDEKLKEVADCLSLYSCNHAAGEDGPVISGVTHSSALSLLTTLGTIGSSFDPSMDDEDDEELKPHCVARKLCTNELAARFATSLKASLQKVEAITEAELDVYGSKMGTLYTNAKESEDDDDVKTSNADKKRAGGKSRRGQGGDSFADEEWERQMKKELAAKKKGAGKSGPATKVLTPAQKKQVEAQDKERRRLKILVEGEYLRTLDSVSALCNSDIEVGNSCLPTFSETVIQAAVSKSDAVQRLPELSKAGLKTLETLAASVYEIDEECAPNMAQALFISCKATNGATTSSISPLPSPCEAASSVIEEMDDYGDCLSGGSFSLLFPIIRAALMGPRTTPGCEGALRVLERHTSMLAGDDVNEFVKPLRREMAETVLELLSHDRSQQFLKPTPFEALIACYVTDTDTSGPALSTSELAPLLGDKGALGSRNCRVGAMKALASIASSHPKLVKNNPLVENRVWMNSFEKDETIREAARDAWRTVTGASDGDLPAPSIMYAIPLLPLMSHSDSSIANAAASANAAAMGLHPKSVEKNVLKLCSTYIDSYAAGNDSKKSSSAPPAMPAALPPKKAPVPIAAIKKKPKISTGLPKKKAKKDALSIAGIGKPKGGTLGRKTAPKKRVDPSLFAKKEERTFDREVLQNQFKMGDKDEESVEKDTPEKIVIRKGMLSAVSSITDKAAKVSLEIGTLKIVTGFLMAYGLADVNEDVRGIARNCLRDVVAVFGSSDDAIAFVLPTLEAVLNSGSLQEESLGPLSRDKILRDADAVNHRKEGAVVALGSVALHLKGAENEKKIDSTIDMLIAALGTSSESVQSSVADCLAKLMKKGKTQERVEVILKNLLADCLYGDSQTKRRGAAYGISAAIKGSGIASLKKYEVVKRLEEACDSGSQSNKEGSLFAIELLSARLGLLFEPYVIVLLPSLLQSFSDSSDHVRTAAANTADLIMSKLSAHGVKLVMPAVLTAFNDPAWRTKQASIQMLGSMSHLAPKQLASALPKVVPQLTEAFSDTHPKVKASAEEALDEISKVVKNPEISSISKVLLTALTDPSEGTLVALETLISTEFLHAIDAPSLALIVPILHRGLRDRVATTKRYGALIAGNICTMINDAKDFLPYLSILLPDLQLALLDPIPDVRSTSAKAVGSLTRGLGEDSFPDLRGWLVEKLRDAGVTSAERSGAAQGLTELLVAGGAEVVEDVMKDEILPLRSHPQASTREGVLWVLTFLPSSLGQSFTPLIDVSLPALIGGLSDEAEPVRDVAMRAGRVMIRSHGKTHVNKILPSLEAGIVDEDYRIRVASLTLLGDLLSMIGGTSVVKGDAETQDDIRKAERAQAQIALALGPETRKRVLSGLYLSRSDTTTVVRQSAVQVWKTVVSVTARTLKDILPVLVSQIVEALASGHPERTQVAGRCLGDIVNKLGDSVLPELIPVLRNALYDGDHHTRQGVCVGLSEVIRCSTKEQILKYIEILVKIVQDALCDDDKGVREMAATCFQSLHNVVGNRALDEIVPSLLVALDYGDDRDESRTKALNGLTGILSIRSRELLPYIIPRLIRSPISINHARALTGIAQVTSKTLYSHFHTILPAMVSELAEINSSEDEKEREDVVRECIRSISKHVDESGVNLLVSEIASKCGNDKAEIRKESCWMLQVVVEERKDKADFYEQIPIILRELLYRCNDDEVTVLKANHAAFGALTKNVPAEELVGHIEFIRNLIASMVSDARRRKGGVGDGEFLMPMFNMPKGLEPLLPIYQRGILYGSPSIREVSASGLGELISMTANKFLAGQLIIKMTGPLLRIVGDRNPAEVKVAILRTLGLVLVKGGPALRAFVPQFQTTFVKALADQSRQVRIEAIKALGLLMPLSTRVDPLLKELVAGSLGKSGGENSGVAAVQTATLEALAVVLNQGGKKAKLPDSIPAALDASKELLSHEDEGVREGAAKVMGAACALLGSEVTTETIKEAVLSGGSASGEVRHGQACACQRIMTSTGGELSEGVSGKVVDLIVSLMKDDKPMVKEAACTALGAAVGSAADPEARLREVEPVILAIMKSSQERMEVQQAVASGLCIALTIASVENKVTFFGKTLLDCCLQQAMSGSQRVQYAYNDVLYLGLSVADGEAGLEAYTEIANFDNSKSMKSLHSKVLSRIKGVDVDV